MAPPSGTNYPIANFEDFWLFYLREHAKPETRALHYLGTGMSTCALLAFIATGYLWLLALIPLTGYGLAWVSHFFVEKNQPATFTYPLWSLAGDYRMVVSWLTGHIGEELERAGVNGS
jgi:hypothetical protein